MSYKLTLKDLKTLESKVFYLELEEYPAEDNLLDDLIHLGIVKDVEAFTSSDWYSNMINGCTILDKKNLTHTIKLQDTAEIPAELSDENSFYVYKVVSHFNTGATSLYTENFFSSSNRNLKFHTGIPEQEILSIKKVLVTSILNASEHKELIEAITKTVPLDVESYDINSYETEEDSDET